MARVGLVFGGRSVEHLVSVNSARTVARGLREAGHDVVPIGIAEDGCFVAPATAALALAGELDALAPVGENILSTLHHFVDAAVEVIFPIVHGTYGEDGTLQGLCAMLDLPCVGASVATSALAMDKVLAKRVLRDAGIPVVEGISLDARRLAAEGDAAFAAAAKWPRPLFVKPSVGGSSVGCRKVGAGQDLREAVEFALGFSEEVLIERGIVGREVECAVLGSPHEGFEASCIGEIVPGREFYDYEDKYLYDGAGLHAPADLPEALATRLRAVAIDAFIAIGGTGMARVDFFAVEPNTIYVNEVNTLPGFTAISMYPKLWGLTGRPLGNLCARLVELARIDHRARQRLNGAVHTWVEAIQKKSRPPQPSSSSK